MEMYWSLFDLGYRGYTEKERVLSVAAGLRTQDIFIFLFVHRSFHTSPETRAKI